MYYSYTEDKRKDSYGEGEVPPAEMGSQTLVPLLHPRLRVGLDSLHDDAQLKSSAQSRQYIPISGGA